MKRFASAILAALGSLAVGTTVQAQTTAREILRQGMVERGYNATYENTERPVFDPEGEFAGLQFSSARAWVAEGGAGTYLLILRNTTQTAYCFWPIVTFSPTRLVVSRPWTHRSSVGPGEHAVLLVANIEPGANISSRYSLAFWRPDETQPYGSQCEASEPEGVQDWLANYDGRSFWGSVR